jgi:DNA-binding CsgD family transcriptional regulator
VKLLERRVELDRIDQLVEAARSGSGRVLAIEAEAGGGKTALLEVAKQRASERRLRVLSARASELERDFAFAVVRQLFEPVVVAANAKERRALSEGAARLGVAALSPTDGDDELRVEDSFAALHGVYWLAANLAARQPLLLAIDDLHWSDLPSVRWLAYLLPRLDGIGALVLITSRPRQPGLAGDVLARREVELHSLGGLSEAGVAQLVRSELSDHASGPFVEACRRATGGNPFLLSELLRELQSQGVTGTAEDARRVAEVNPEAVARWVRLRLSGLGDRAERVARAVSVLGARPDLRRVAQLAGVDEAEAAVTANELAHAGVLGDLEAFEFVHPIIRQAVYATIPPPERGLLHGRAASLLREAGATAEEVALHLVKGSRTEAAWAVDHLRAAAQDAHKRGAPDVAAAYLASALAHTREGPVRSRVLWELGSAELESGSLPGASVGDAVGHLREALRLAEDPPERGAIALELGDALWGGWHADQALEVFDRAIRELNADERELELLLRAHAAGACLFSGRLARHARERLAELEGVEGTSPAERLVLGLRAYACAWSGDSADETAALARRALEHPDGEPASHMSPMTLNFAPVALVFAEHLDTAEDTLRHVIDEARTRGDVRSLSIAYCWSSRIAYLRGAIAAAEADARTALELAQMRGLGTKVPLTHAFLIDALLEGGDVDTARQTLDATELPETVPEYAGWTWLLVRRGQLRLAGGELERGLDDLHAAGQRQLDWGPHAPSALSWRLHAAVGHAARGDRDEASRLAHEELELAQHFGAPTAIGAALRVRATVAEARPSLAGLESAVAVLEEAPGRLELARALTELGAALRRDNQRVAARDPLRRALDIAQGSGARLTATRAHQELVATGARPRRLRTTGGDALTASERRVAEMAAHGMSNREIAQTLFVTVKTIEVHLSNAYRKLDITSRKELPEALGAESASASIQPA